MKDQDIKKLLDSQSIQRINEMTCEMSALGCDGSRFGFRTSGSSGENKIAEYIFNKMKEIGLQNVTMDEFPVDAWGLLDGQLEITDAADNSKICFDISSYAGLPGTPAEGITSEIVDVNKGRKCDYSGKDVKGKIILCSIDILADYWPNIVATQAKEMGAACILVSYEGNRYSCDGDAIGCFDSQGGPLPVGVISRNAAAEIRDLLAKNEKVEATVKISVEFDRNGKSHNVVGYILGEETDRYIMLSAHMDGFFHAYQDDLLCVAINLEVAKSIIESGIKPKHTIIVAANGSEEYGVADSRYDWCIGSYYALKLHPDWFGKIDICLNSDALRPDTPKLFIYSSPEYHEVFRGFLSNLEVPKDCWPEGADVIGMHGPWSDDYNFSINGIPGLIIGKGPSEWSENNYHTQFDDKSIFEKEKGVIKFAAELYTRFIAEFDSKVLPPIDFVPAMNDFIDSFENAESFFKDETNQLKSKAEKIKACSANLNVVIGKINHELPNDFPIEACRSHLFHAYRSLTRDLLKLSALDDVIYAHVQVADDCRYLSDLIVALHDKDSEKAIELFRKIDINTYAVDFDKQTFKRIMEQQSPENGKLFWGEGKLHELYDGSDLIEQIKQSQFDEAITSAEAALDEERKQLKNIMDNEDKILDSIYEELVMASSS